MECSPINASQDIQMVQEVRREMPDVGESMVSGGLRAMGVQVTTAVLAAQIEHLSGIYSNIRSS